VKSIFCVGAKKLVTATRRIQMKSESIAAADRPLKGKNTGFFAALRMTRILHAKIFGKSEGSRSVYSGPR
jgi:hypothetical protein